MPTVLRVGPYRFFFYAGDRDEPPHIHVKRDKAEAKYWLSPVRLERSHRFMPYELRDIETIIIENEQDLLEEWNDYFND